MKSILTVAKLLELNTNDDNNKIKKQIMTIEIDSDEKASVMRINKKVRGNDMCKFIENSRFTIRYESSLITPTKPSH